jgi:hypothetical protein
MELQYNDRVIDCYLTVSKRRPFNPINADSDVRTLAMCNTDARLADELLLHLIELTRPLVHAGIQP